MSAHPPSVKRMPTIFGEVFEKNIVFCLDTSGSMYRGLDMVKEHLIETLLKHSRKNHPAMFNIIEFNSEVTQWADKLVRCTPETVTVASKWISELGAKTGTNTQDALLTAFSDPSCAAVYLVTDGLPDKHPADIVDHIIYASKQRPVHCIYLTTEESIDSAAIEFLEDLAVETYGSFHIVSLTTHGFVEKITPIYRSEYAGNKVIRTLNGTLHTDPKSCSVTTTLQVDPEESLNLTRRVSMMGHNPEYMPPWWPSHHQWLGNPYRYNYPYWWTRYRPAKTWLKTHKEMVDWMESPDLSPAAGSLLIGKVVLARRIDDGYFYKGTVKSQILSNKFLVAFGPCKHGKYQDTAYQDTYVHDIVDYEDGKRHTIQTGDKVLASWEPEGERWGPGIVIDGYEKRLSQGPIDKEMAVTFSVGRTERVPLDTAVWVPPPLYERLALELKMPQVARESLQEQDRYPKESLPGYPTSGSQVEDFVAPSPVQFDNDPLFVKSMPWMFGQHYVPAYPVMYKHEHEVKSAVKSEDINALIPGTSMTKKDLDDKVMSQIMEHKLLLGDRQNGRNFTENDRLLRKREKQEINQLKKSVTFDGDMFDREKINLDESLRNGGETQDRLYSREINGHVEFPHSDCDEEISRRPHLQRQRKLAEKREYYDRARMEHSKELDENNRRRDEIDLELNENNRRRDEIDLELNGNNRQRDEIDLENEKAKIEGYSRWQNENDVATMEDEELKYGVRQRYSDDCQQLPFTEYDREMAEIESKNQNHRNPYPHEANDAELSYRKRGPTLTPEPYVMRRCKGPQPHWKSHWKADPIPPLSNSQPFRETALQAPLEARDPRNSPSIVEWSSPVYKYVDHLAKHDCYNSVGQLMKTPKPPEKGKGYIQWSDRVIPRPMTEDEKRESRQEYKRRKVVERQTEHDIKVLQQELKQEFMQDQHRQKILDQINHDQERQTRETRAVKQCLVAKKQISSEIRSNNEASQKREQKRQDQRIEAMREKREQRESVDAQQKLDIEDREERREQAKSQRATDRWDEVPMKLDQEEKQMKEQLDKAQAAKISRIEHYEQLEKIGQMKKDLRVNVTDSSMAMYRSQVLP